MTQAFHDIVAAFPQRMDELLSMPPVGMSQLPGRIPRAGIYLISEGGVPVYTGRSMKLRARLQSHWRETSRDSASFAYSLTAENTGLGSIKGSPDGNRKKMMSHPVFGPEFIRQKRRISEMQVRFIEVTDLTVQILLEVYVALALKTKYNRFDNLAADARLPGDSA